MKRLYILIAAAVLMLMAAPVFAAEAKFEASLDRNQVAIGETAQLGLTFYGTQGMPAPDIDKADGLEIRYIGPSTMMTVLNGQVSRSITHMYAIQPLRTGSFQLGPFTFQHKGVTYTSNAVTLEVDEEKTVRAAPRSAPIVEKIDLGDRMFVTLEAAKLTGYVNELIPVTVKLFVNRMNVSDIQLPVFEQEEFSKVAFKEPRQYRQSIGGVLYDILEFKTDIFGTKPGDYDLGPAMIKCNVMLRKKLPAGRSMHDDFFGDEFARDSFFDDFFTRYERHPVELTSKKVKLVILPLPADGRPRDFSGAVGDYQFIMKAEPTAVKVGDPITLHMAINGKGNFNTVIAPQVPETAGLRVYEAQVKTGENTKEFKQVVIPQTAAAKEIPPLTFTFFDPYEKKYRSLTRGPVSIVVEKAADQAPSQLIGPAGAPERATEEPSRDIIGIKETPGRWLRTGWRLYTSPIVPAAFIAPPVLLVILAFIQRRRDRIKSDSAYAGRLFAFKVQRRAERRLRRALKAEGYHSFYEHLFKTVQEYMGNRLNIPTAGITYEVIAAALADKEIDTGVMEKLRRLCAACDEAKFAQAADAEMRIEGLMKDLRDIMRYLERRKI